jgi:acyl-CoA thioester hydrolase
MPHNLETLISEHSSVMSLPILWGDMDAFRHVNNTASIRWFESSRIRLIEHPEISGVLNTHGIAPILASVSCNYRRQLRYPDTVHVGSKVSTLGNTSLTIQHAVFSEQQDCIASDGHSVVVCFDYKAQRPVRIPDGLRDAIERMQERTSSS